MNWFNDVFLQSVFVKAGTNKPLWLTRAQVNVCIDNMDKHTFTTAAYQGDMTKHVYYTHQWQGRSVRLDYSKLNGCGTISFGLTDSEAKANNLQNDIRRDQLEREQNARRIRLHPDRHEKMVAEIRINLDIATKYLAESLKSGNKEDIDEDIKSVEYYKKELEKITKL